MSTEALFLHIPTNSRLNTIGILVYLSKCSSIVSSQEHSGP